MRWLFYQWGRFIWWADHLSAREAAILGAVSLAFVTGIGKYFLVPFMTSACKRLGGWLYPLLSGAFIFNRIVALPKYFKSIQTTVGRLRNPWLLEGQQLRDIFVPVSVNRGLGSSEHCDVRLLLHTLRAAVIIGDPGTGKTTALKAVAMTCLQRWQVHRAGYVPVYIPLRAWGVANTDLTKYMEEVFRENNFPNAGRYVKRLKRQGRLVFLFDGLDEVDESNKPFIVGQIRVLLTEEIRESGCPVYITSRPVGYDGQFNDLIQDTAYMKEFVPAQIRQFIGNWDFRLPKTGAKLFQALVSRPAILLICRNPLMLTIVTSLYRETEYQLPDSRDAFYKVCIQALLTRWDAAREMDNRNRYPEGLKEAFLQELAYAYLSQRGRDLSASWVLEQVEAFLTHRNRLQINADAFLHEIVRSGLLGKLPTGELYFAHKTFSEALAASRFRNKPEELMNLWEAAPETWLEVCSLYVSDSLTPVGDIEVVLNRSINRQAWQMVIVLAGEAHTSSDEFRSSIVRRLQEDRSLWPGLDKRAMAALARFGNAARPLLTEFMSESSVEMRQLAVYALGQCTEEWAMELLIAALTDPTTQKSAAESLGGLGEDAIVLIEDLLRTRSGNSELARACTEVAGIIGTAGAIRTIMPLLWSEVAFDAAWQIARLLWLPEVRTTLESGEFPLSQPPVQPPDDLAHWAFPWLPEAAATLRTYYARVSQVLLDAVRREGETVLESLPPDLLVPILIALGFDKRAKRLVEDRFGDPESDAKATASQPMWTIIVPELSKRTDDKNRVLWSRVTARDKEDIALSPHVSRAVWAIATVGLIAIMVRGATNHFLSWWWFSLPGLYIGILCFGAFFDRDPSAPLRFVGAPTAAFSLILRRSIHYKEDKVMGWVIALYHASLMLCAAVSTQRLGGSWLALSCVLIPTFVPTEDAPNGIRMVLYRRSNPLRRLRNSLPMNVSPSFAALPLRPVFMSKISVSSTSKT
jgi:NACHT domain